MPDPTAPERIADAKQALRRPLIEARRVRSGPARAAARDAIGEHLLRALATVRSVAAHLPLPSEPLPRELLRTLAATRRVLIPVVTGPSPLDWCEFTEATRPGQLGIEEPDGPRLGADVVGDVDAVLVPALAVGLDGYRLGRGGGHYDRTLALRAALRRAGDDLLIALVYDDEFGLDVPHDELDRPVTAAVTPTRGLVRLAPPAVDPRPASG